MPPEARDYEPRWPWTAAPTASRCSAVSRPRPRTGWPAVRLLIETGRGAGRLDGRAAVLRRARRRRGERRRGGRDRRDRPPGILNRQDGAVSGADVRYGVWATLGEPRTAAALTASGLDWVALDQQHGHFDDRAMRETLALTPGRAVPLLVRVQANDAGLIGRVLDAGGDGVIVPLVDSPEQAAAAVAAAHHPPHGTRSWGFLPDTARTDGRPVRRGDDRDRGRARRASRRSRRCPGSTCSSSARSTCRCGSARPSTPCSRTADREAPLPRVLAAAARAGVTAGAFGAEPARAAVLASLGFSWVIVTTDAGLLAAGRLAARPHRASTTEPGRALRERRRKRPAQAGSYRFGPVQRENSVDCAVTR